MKARRKKGYKGYRQQARTDTRVRLDLVILRRAAGLRVRVRPAVHRAGPGRAVCVWGGWNMVYRAPFSISRAPVDRDWSILYSWPHFAPHSCRRLSWGYSSIWCTLRVRICGLRTRFQPPLRGLCSEKLPHVVDAIGAAGACVGWLGGACICRSFVGPFVFLERALVCRGLRGGLAFMVLGP